jgi:hypothetical protein
MVNSISDQSDNVREWMTVFGDIDEVQTLVWMRAVCGLVGL